LTVLDLLRIYCHHTMDDKGVLVLPSQPFFIFTHLIHFVLNYMRKSYLPFSNLLVFHFLLGLGVR